MGHQILKVARLLQDYIAENTTYDYEHHVPKCAKFITSVFGNSNSNLRNWRKVGLNSKLGTGVPKHTIRVIFPSICVYGFLRNLEEN